MKRICEVCRVFYDDTYRWTYCPHDSFEMNTFVRRSDGEERVVHTVEELQEFLDETR